MSDVILKGQNVDKEYIGVKMEYLTRAERTIFNYHKPTSKLDKANTW